MLKCVKLSIIVDLTAQGGEFLMAKKEEVLTTTTSEGDTRFMVCKPSEENKSEKVCMDVADQTVKPSSRNASGKTMLDNNTYDLMEQLLVENRSLWRIKNNYKNDSASDNESKQLWRVIEKDKEEIVQLLTEKLKERL